MRKFSLRRFAKFARDERGASAVVFGLAVVPVLAAAGASLDFSVAYRTKAELLNALDAAALDAARTYRDTADATLADQRGRATFAAARPPNVEATMTGLTIDPVTGAVDVRATARSQARFLGLVTSQYGSLALNGASRSIAGAIEQGKDLEVALMLDVTSSMTQNSGTSGMTKLGAMQQAARSFVDTVIQTSQTPHTSRAALAPFSSAVNVGTLFSAVTNTAPVSGWTSVVERSGPSSATDDPPSSAFFPSYRARHGGAQSPVSMYANIERNRTSNIPVGSNVLPLTSDRQALTTAINALAANGTTAGHLGTAWAWYLLSPRWSGVWGSAAPAAYDPARTVKVAILMSDFDYNVYYQTANGDMNAQARALCANMKAAGITVYTIGFQVDNALPDAVDLFTNCASDPSKAIRANTGAELIASYQALAQTVRASVASPVRLAR